MGLFIKVCLVVLGTFLSSFIVPNECVSTLFSSSTLIKQSVLGIYLNFLFFPNILLFVNNHNYMNLFILYHMHDILKKSILRLL